jgi:hypothetical protein
MGMCVYIFAVSGKQLCMQGCNACKLIPLLLYISTQTGQRKVCVDLVHVITFCMRRLLDWIIPDEYYDLLRLIFIGDKHKLPLQIA